MKKRDVFIAYHSDMREEARALRKILEKNLYTCWMAPDDIPLWKNYTSAVPDAIENCAVFVPVLSAKTEESKWLFKELDIAINGEKVIMPFIASPFELNGAIEFYLADIKKYGEKESKVEALQHLLEDLEKAVGTEKATLRKRGKANPYRKLNDKEEYLAMDTFSVVYFVEWVLWVLCTWRDLGVEGAIIGAVALGIVWCMSGKLARRIARSGNKKKIIWSAALLAVLIGPIFGIVMFLLVAVLILLFLDRL